ncbi:hypothetical protein [Methylococcus sp. EFPC2]|uniref:hypothetical protein n=1 Tax=Methylococcus sp. EFPC2 TaxID=2812648 RepID=UPI001967A4CB|nr:hypothetical protein [Methylococcus sp. EFPC2]QSA97553.1 hypothetical protein JWZ97_01520 [Methylococcus sp. EFPC2]
MTRNTALAMIVATSIFSPLSEASTIAGLVNTGQGLSSGTVDTHYAFETLSGTATGTGGYGVVAPNSGFPLNYWIANTEASKWLAPTANAAQSYDALSEGHYKWTLDFDLSGYDASTASFSARFSADNGATVKLNGVSLTSTPYPVSYRDWTSFGTESGFVGGINTLEFFVTNERRGSGNPTGLRVEFLSSNVDVAKVTTPPVQLGVQAVPIPPALALLASSLPVLLLGKRRGRA